MLNSHCTLLPLKTRGACQETEKCASCLCAARRARISWEKKKYLELEQTFTRTSRARSRGPPPRCSHIAISHGENRKQVRTSVSSLLSPLLPLCYFRANPERMAFRMFRSRRGPFLCRELIYFFVKPFAEREMCSGRDSRESGSSSSRRLRGRYSGASSAAQAGRRDSGRK